MPSENGSVNETGPSGVVAVRVTVNATAAADDPDTVGKLKCVSVPTTKFAFSGIVPAAVGVNPRPLWTVPTGWPQRSCVGGGAAHAGWPLLPQMLMLVPP